MEEFAAKLKRLRLAHGLTQAELAEKLFVSKQAVSKWENAKAMPDVELLPKIAAIYGMNLDSLMSDETRGENADGNAVNESAENIGNNAPGNVEGINGAADNPLSGNAAAIGGAQTDSRAEDESAGKPEKKRKADTKFLKNLILVCLPVLILVVVASVLLSVYLPEKTPENPPVTDTPPVEEDPEPVFTEIRAMGEDYHKNSYIYSFTGAENWEEGKKKPDKAYYRFNPKLSSDYMFTIETAELDEYSRRFYSEAKVRVYVYKLLVAEGSYGETLTCSYFMKGNHTYEVTIELYNPYKGKILNFIYDNGPHYIKTSMSFQMKLDYKHDFENIIVPYRSTYTVALRANDYIVEESDEMSSKIVSSVKTFRIVNSDVLKIIDVSRMAILDPSMEQWYISDSVNSYFSRIDDAGTNYIELLFRCPSYQVICPSFYEEKFGVYYYDDEYNNDFYYLTIKNDTWDNIPLQIETGDVETLNCSSPLNIPAKEEGWGVNYRYYYLDAKEIRKVDSLLVWSYFLVSIEDFYPSNYFYTTEGYNRRQDEEYIDWNDDGWKSIKVYSFDECYIRVPIDDTPYQIRIEPWKSGE